MEAAQMCEQLELMRLGVAGKEVREVLARHKLTLDQEKKVLVAPLAQKTIQGRRQDEWVGGGQRNARYGLWLHPGCQQAPGRGLRRGAG